MDLAHGDNKTEFKQSFWVHRYDKEKAEDDMWKNKEYYYILFKNELNESFDQDYWLSSRYFAQSDITGSFGLCSVWTINKADVFGSWLYITTRRK